MGPGWPLRKRIGLVRLIRCLCTPCQLKCTTEAGGRRSLSRPRVECRVHRPSRHAHTRCSRRAPLLLISHGFQRPMVSSLLGSIRVSSIAVASHRRCPAMTWSWGKTANGSRSHQMMGRRLIPMGPCSPRGRQAHRGPFNLRAVRRGGGPPPARPTTWSPRRLVKGIPARVGPRQAVQRRVARRRAALRRAALRRAVRRRVVRRRAARRRAARRRAVQRWVVRLRAGRVWVILNQVGRSRYSPRRVGGVRR